MENGTYHWTPNGGDESPPGPKDPVASKSAEF